MQDEEMNNRQYAKQVRFTSTIETPKTELRYKK